MLLLRIGLLLLLLGGVLCFGLYALKGDRRYRVLGNRLVVAALVVAALFFGGLIIERLPQLL